MRWLWRGLTSCLVALLVMPAVAQAQISSSVGLTLCIAPCSTTGDVRFIGYAFPGAIVTFLDGGSVAGTTVANSDSFFDKTLTSLTPGIHNFGLFGQALDGRTTLTISFDVNVITGMTITVGGGPGAPIILPPIISVPATEKRPKLLVENGLARHTSSDTSTVTTFTSNVDTITKQATTNASGDWVVTVDHILHLGPHNVNGLVQDGNGAQSVLTNSQTVQVLLSADLNVDNLTNLTDFSILMFSYGTTNPPNLAADINDNGPVDLVDFSVMMFYWTGG